MTFAGSPDRVEARLVPEAGYELDPFRISGFPRRPSPALARSLLLAGAAPFHCRRILRRRRPDVVLGGGGFADDCAPAGCLVQLGGAQAVPARGLAAARAGATADPADATASKPTPASVHTIR